MADVSVRPATGADVAEIARIQVETWRSAYRTVLPAPVLDGLSIDGAAQAWAAAVASPPSPRHHVLVALEQQWVVGFVALAPDEVEAEGSAVDEEIALGLTAAVGPLLVEPRWGRRGHGSRLLAAAVDTARADGLQRAIAWVPEADRTTQDFLASAGWEPDGVVRGLDTGVGELREVRLHVAIGADGG
ncbi:MAG: GNAT family N-acetyltransferase [Jatrophihabitans sp.]|uniref:GNAT family N-acetyltransferase n=1 Tax=Jatrophihabitans sp. TaxID=1932789 RepID=UPI003F7D2345